MKIPTNILDVYLLYSEWIKAQYPSDRAKRIIQETRSAFQHFLIFGLGYNKYPAGRKMTQVEAQAAYEYMAKIPISSLSSLDQAISKGFILTKASSTSQKTYGGRIKQLIAWGEDQYWWTREEELPVKDRYRYSPKIRKDKSQYNEKHLTERNYVYSTYQLAPEETSPMLEAEFVQFYKFLREPQWPGRLSQAISESSSKTYLKHLRLILGWLHRYQKVPLSDLSLNLLVPKITEDVLEDLSEDERHKLWQQHQAKFDNLLCNYFQFLREVMLSFSPGTKKFKMNAFLALAKFQYHTEIDHINDYKKIPIIKTIYRHSSNVRKENKQWESQKRSSVNLSKKWPQVISTKTALSTVRLQILEPLRLECRFKYQNLHLRDGNAIAASIQRYLMWSFLADIPARRQEEYRSLQVALFCPIDRPSEVPPDGLYQPLPPAEARKKNRDGSFQDNFIYKTYVYQNIYYESGIWILDIQSYKTSNFYGPQSIKVPNREFNDGTCLYDYIERHLYGWYLEENRDQKGQWLTPGRICFNPKSINNQFGSFGYFFIQPLTGSGYDSNSFNAVVNTAAYRLSGVSITPHIMRLIWATWAYQVGLTDQQRESLAYAMGHDIKTMLELYEKCTPDEKRRPIEEVIDAVLFNDLSTVNTDKNNDSESKLENFYQEISQLPKHQLQQVILQLQKP